MSTAVSKAFKPVSLWLLWSAGRWVWSQGEPSTHCLTWAFLLLQLVSYWEKTFKIDLFKPQIGVVNVTDVSILPKGWSDGLSQPVGCSADPGTKITQESIAARETLGSFPNSCSKAQDWALASPSLLWEYISLLTELAQPDSLT